MRKKHSIMIVITMILSTTCILGVSLYDTKSETVTRIYQAVNNLQINITQAEVNFSLVKEGDKLTEDELYAMNTEFSEILSHNEACSKFCSQIHGHTVSSSMWQEENSFNLQLISYSNTPKFVMNIKSQAQNNFKTTAKMHIEGYGHVEEIQKIDNIRELTWRVYKKLNKTPKENLIFHAYVNKKLNREEMQQYAAKLYESLEAKPRHFYQDDLNQTTAAFYGYTKEFNQYVLDEKGEKSNIQIGFSYDEIRDKTYIVIAFPFYNEVF